MISLKKMLFSKSILYCKPDTRATSSDLFILPKQSSDNAIIPVIVSERCAEKIKKVEEVMLIQTNVKC